MAREIKFRAWDWSTAEMLYPSDGYWYVGTGASDVQVLRDVKTVNGIATELGPVINGDLMQFTGLLDKNGKEIYEDDRVLCYVNGVVKGDPDQVKFKDGQFRLSNRHCSLRTWLYCPDELFRQGVDCHLEVIGNIYEPLPAQ